MNKYFYRSLIGLLALVLFSSSACAAEWADQPIASEKYQFRAAWIATVANIDWPSKPGLTVWQQQDEFVRLLDTAADLKLNAVIVQIRPTADAFYQSSLNPWSEYLTGVQGADPGYDPLAFMVEQAHARNLELHAWFNPFRASNTVDDKSWDQQSVIVKHPDWIVNYGNKKYINPGIPEARDYVLQSVIEVVRNYDIDAVHFDDYFYPYPVSGSVFPDEWTYNLYNNGEFSNIGDWRRNNINQFIKSVYEGIKMEKEHVKLGVSPFAIWRSKAVDPTGVETGSDLSTYDKLYADTRLWVRNKWVDYIAPQIYWEFSHSVAPYEGILNFWVEEMENNRDVHLYVGHATYKVGTGDSSWLDVQEIPNQLKLNRQHDVVKGSIFYNMSSLVNNSLGFKDEIKSDLYKYYALIPPAREVPAEGVGAGSAAIEGIKPGYGQNEITITSYGDDIDYFVIYRSEGAAKLNINDPSQIIGTVKNGLTDRQVYVDWLDAAHSGKTFAYAVTAVSRMDVESAPSQPVSVVNK